ncbi:hypothetical protein EON67_06915 [archaeon]|nr:MAG: hypothetical protein EON67_06915 [archaeon]
MAANVYPRTPPRVALPAGFRIADGRLGVSPITGVEVPRNKGQYTLKRYHLKSKMPRVGT